MIELFGSALVTFLVIIDPPGCAPIFASLTRGTSPVHRRAMAVRSSLIAWAILMFFALLGRPMLQALGMGNGVRHRTIVPDGGDNAEATVWAGGLDRIHAGRSC